MVLWLVRHAETDANDAATLVGWSDPPLNERGERTARELRAKLGAHRFAGRWTSDLLRAVQTAELAVGGAIADPRLRELDMGDLDGLRFEECPAAVRDALVAFDGFSAPGGESTAALRERLESFISSLTAGDHLVVTHGGPIRVLLREAGRDEGVEPGGVVRLEVTPGGSGGVAQGIRFLDRGVEHRP